MHIRIRNITTRPLSEGATSGEHAYLEPGQVKSVPLEIGKKWCSLGYASIEIEEDTVCSAPPVQSPAPTRQPHAAHKIMGKSKAKEEDSNA
mgnify:CR=1 FL=1